MRSIPTFSGTPTSSTPPTRKGYISHTQSLLLPLFHSPSSFFSPSLPFSLINPAPPSTHLLPTFYPPCTLTVSSLSLSLSLSDRALVLLEGPDPGWRDEAHCGLAAFDRSTGLVFHTDPGQLFPPSTHLLPPSTHLPPTLYPPSTHLLNIDPQVSSRRMTERSSLSTAVARNTLSSGDLLLIPLQSLSLPLFLMLPPSYSSSSLVQSLIIISLPFPF